MQPEEREQRLLTKLSEMFGREALNNIDYAEMVSNTALFVLQKQAGILIQINHWNSFFFNSIGLYKIIQ